LKKTNAVERAWSDFSVLTMGWTPSKASLQPVSRGYFNNLLGVIVLFLQIDTVSPKNPFCDKSLGILRFATRRPFHADWYALA
jgi:hypothetical protein